MTDDTGRTPAFDPDLRTYPPAQGTELETLLAFLHYQRDTFRWKTGGLTSEQLAVALPPTGMTLGGMIKHLAFVEVWWFHEVFGGHPAPEPWAAVDWDADPDWDWHSAAADAPPQLTGLYERCVRLAEAALSSALPHPGLDALSVRSGGAPKQPFSLRWIVTHMIEEAGE